jgi:hypothetical protein
MTDGDETSLAALSLRGQNQRRAGDSAGTTHHVVVPRTRQAQRIRAIIDRNRIVRGPSDGNGGDALDETIAAVVSNVGRLATCPFPCFSLALLFFSCQPSFDP